MKSTNAQRTTPTELRKNLSRRLRQVRNGATVSIETREGRVYLVSEEFVKKAKGRRIVRTSQPKIPGCIVGNLHDADDMLRKYIILPS